MNMTMKEYDGTLAVACIVLAVVLNALQISHITDGLMMASRQNYPLSVMFAVVISCGLMYSVFAGHRLKGKGQALAYSWALATLAGLLTGGMAAWSLSHTAGLWSFRFWIGVFLGASIPVQTLVLCNMTTGMFDLAGSSWWNNSWLKSVLSLVLPADSKVHPKKVPSKRMESAEVVLTSDDVKSALAVVSRELVLDSDIDSPNSEPVSQPVVVQEAQVKLEASAPVKKEAPAVAKEVEPSKLDLPAPVQVDPVVVSDAVSQDALPKPQVTSAPVAAREDVRPVVVSDAGTVKISLSGDRITLLVRQELSKSKWKDLHSQLRRVASVSWDNAERAESEDGKRDRVLEGVILIPERKGKKGKKKREGARQRHLDAVSAEVQALVQRYV